MVKTCNELFTGKSYGKKMYRSKNAKYTKCITFFINKIIANKKEEAC